MSGTNAERIPQQETTEALQSLVKGAPDVLFILAGPNRHHEVRGYVAASFNEGDERSAMALHDEEIVARLLEGGAMTADEIEQARKDGLPTGANDRIVATAAMHRAFPKADIVTVTRPTDRPNEPTYAEVAASGLIRRGVPEDKIHAENAPAVNTITEFKEAARLWKSTMTITTEVNGEPVPEYPIKNIVFITAEWHVRRAKALLNRIENFATDEAEAALLKEFADAIHSEKLTIQFVDTTTVLSTVSPRFARVFEKVNESPGMKARIALEKNAVAQIAGGTYGNKKLIHKIWDDQP